MNKKNIFNHRFFLALSLLIFMLFSFVGCQSPQQSQETSSLSTQTMEVSFVDVGQGDCIFVKLPDSKTMLIDCGEKSKYDEVESFLSDWGVKKIDYLVATHPHSDHIGGMANIINNYEIGKFFMPEKESTSNVFMEMLDALLKNNIDSAYAVAGDVIFEGDNFRCDVLSPVLETYKEVNDYSVVLKLTYNDVSFLFTGDAEVYAEKQITGDVSADVLKVGHHGSKTSTSKEFLKKVDPQYAVISCGKNNSYNHPDKETTKLLEDEDIRILCTDEMGTITFVCDGANVILK